MRWEGVKRRAGLGGRGRVEEWVHDYSSMFFELCADLLRDLQRQSRTAFQGEVQLVDKDLCELVGRHERLVQVPEEAVLDAELWSHVGSLVGRRVLVNTKLARIVGLGQRSLWLVRVDAQVDADGNEVERELCLQHGLSFCHGLLGLSHPFAPDTLNVDGTAEFC